MKQITTLFTFAFEDGPELILEYFYIEKYFTKDHLASYLITKGFVVELILLLLFLTYVVTCCNDVKLDGDDICPDTDGFHVTHLCHLLYFSI